MYKLLEVGEVIEASDEYWACFSWQTVERYEIGDKIGSHDTPHRRRVAQPAPVVSVGDRVKVLSGPWAGCTGVVLSWSVEITITGGEMKAKTDSQPVVRLDHVWVGGQRLGLTLAAIDVEKLPPVVPDVLYRDLAIGEVIRKTDEYLSLDFNTWKSGEDTPKGIGETIKRFHVRHRRPVRIQSPGWRYLDAGETVLAGDETPVEILGWRRLPIANGMKVGNEKLFRRKLPANVGG